MKCLQSLDTVPGTWNNRARWALGRTRGGGIAVVGAGWGVWTEAHPSRGGPALSTWPPGSLGAAPGCVPGWGQLRPVAVRMKPPAHTASQAVDCLGGSLRVCATPFFSVGAKPSWDPTRTGVGFELCGSWRLTATDSHLHYNTFINLLYPQNEAGCCRSAVQFNARSALLAMKIPAEGDVPVQGKSRLEVPPSRLTPREPWGPRKPACQFQLYLLPALYLAIVSLWVSAEIK